MEPDRKDIRELARRAFEMRPDKDAERVTAFVYWWRDRDIILFDLKHFVGRIIHTVEFDTDGVMVTVCILK